MVTAHHPPFPPICTSRGCLGTAQVYGVTPWCSEPDAAARLIALPVRWLCSIRGTMSLQPLDALWCISGEGTGRAVHLLGEFVLPLHQRALTVLLFRVTCLPSERPKRHQKVLVFKAFLEKDRTILLCFPPYSSQSPSHKNKQPNRLTRRLPSAFGRTRSAGQMLEALFVGHRTGRGFFCYFTTRPHYPLLRLHTSVALCIEPQDFLQEMETRLWWIWLKYSLLTMV